MIQLLPCQVALISSHEMDTCSYSAGEFPATLTVLQAMHGYLMMRVQTTLNVKKKNIYIWKSRLPPAPAPEFIIVSRTVQLNVYRPCSVDILLLLPSLVCLETP